MKLVYELPATVTNATGNEGNPPEGSVWWSGKSGVPAIGDKVNVRINGLGEGTVTAYAIAAGWLGLVVQLSNAPKWFLDRSPKNGSLPTNACVVFGAEVSPLEALA